LKTTASGVETLLPVLPINARMGSQAGGCWVRRQDRFPYAWCIAISAALAVGLLPWVPLLPFAGALSAWMRLILDAVFGLSLGLAYDELLTVSLPIVGAATLAVPLLAFCARRGSRSALRPRAWGVVTGWIVLGAMTVAGEVAVLGASWAWAEIAASSASGVLLAALGVRLRGQPTLPEDDRRLGVALVLLGACIGSCVLLPLGLFFLLIAYVLLGIALAKRQAIHAPA
jgi:hypothetical protein